MVESGWKLENGEIRVTVEIPFNTTAEIILPDADGAEVLENGKPVSGSSFTRGPGRWEYAYKPNGNSISKRIIPDIIPDF